MPVESVVTGIGDLNPAWPLGSDQKQYGDDHIRNIKTAIKTLLTAGEQLGNTTIEQYLNVPTTNIVFNGVIQRGSQVVVFLQQDPTGGRAVTWDAAKFDITPLTTEINTAPNGLTICSFVARSNAKLACYSVRGTVAAAVPALGSHGAFLMDNSGSAPNPVWRRLPFQANTKLNTSGTDLVILGNVGNWDYRLLRIGAYKIDPAAPFSFKVRKDTAFGGSAYVTATNVVCNSASIAATDVILEQQEFKDSHTLRVEFDSAPPANVPFTVFVAYEPFEG